MANEIIDQLAPNVHGMLRILHMLEVEDRDLPALILTRWRDMSLLRRISKSKSTKRRWILDQSLVPDTSACTARCLLLLPVQ